VLDQASEKFWDSGAMFDAWLEGPACSSRENSTQLAGYIERVPRRIQSADCASRVPGTYSICLGLEETKPTLAIASCTVTKSSKLRSGAIGCSSNLETYPPLRHLLLANAGESVECPSGKGAQSWAHSFNHRIMEVRVACGGQEL
jgi:hypothetical protein